MAIVQILDRPGRRLFKISYAPYRSETDQSGPLSGMEAGALSRTAKRSGAGVPGVLPSRDNSLTGAHRMKIYSRALALFLLLLFGALPLLAGTSIVYRWVLTGLPMPKLQKILVLGLTENYILRQDFEDEMETQLIKYGVQGVKSHMVLPPRNEMMEGELKQRIKESTLDAVLVVRPVAVRKETEEVVTGGFYSPPPGYYNFWPYWNVAYTQAIATTSYLRENTIVRAECNIYYTKDEKLLWSGESDTLYEKNFEKMGKSYAKTLVKQLKKDGVIGKK
jgi:hypothetical protein